MTTQPITRVLMGKLNEAYFVFRQLPKHLNSAANRLGVHQFRDRVVAHAAALMERADRVIQLMYNWGRRKPEPCTCEDLSAEMNDLRHAVKSDPPKRWLASTTLRIANRLSGMVRERLEEARKIAAQVNEPVLAAEIQELLDQERQADEAFTGAAPSE